MLEGRPEDGIGRGQKAERALMGDQTCASRMDESFTNQ